MQCVQTQGGRSDRESGRRTRKITRLRGDQGVAALEFAILLPVLAILICGVIDYGRVYHLKNQLKNAAREGAIYGQTHPLAQDTPPFDGPGCEDLQSIQARAYEELQQSGQAKPENLTIIVSPLTTCGQAVPDDYVSPADGDTVPDLNSGEELTVSARASYRMITPLIGAFFGSPITITDSVIVEIQ